MCVDYRALNKITIKDMFLIPNIDELLEELQVITKYGCLKKIYRKQHLELIKDIVSSWLCPLGYRMPLAPFKI